MKKLFVSKWFYVVVTIAAIGVVFLMISRVLNDNQVALVTTAVESGAVRQIVSVSGIAKAEQSAELAFPSGGIVDRVLVKKGDVVKAGDMLITLESRALYADRLEAVAALNQAVATRDELLNGPTSFTRGVTDETVTTKKLALATTEETEQRKVENARRTLLSDGLAAYTTDGNEEATPPIVSGTYLCATEGEYWLTIYPSGANSGYSYKLSGLETGTFTVAIDQPTPLGKCGLQIQFDSDSNYSQSNWVVTVPNTRSSSYLANRNAYDLAIAQAVSNIDLARQALALAEASAADDNAPARAEAIARVHATIAQAQARLDRVDATFADRTLRAPFDGTITEIDLLPGETVTTAPILTLLTDSNFEVIARVPEIDIGKIRPGQKVELVFDAKDKETLIGHVNFISLKATEIDGVAYYEATILFDQQIPEWMRSGLNADVDIVVAEEARALRLPKRFVTKTDSGYHVLLQQGQTIASTTVTVSFEGNDGYLAVTNLTEGDIVVAP